MVMSQIFFWEEVWPYYLAGLEHGEVSGAGRSYWLSYDELLVLAIIANIKLIVVEESPDGFYHRGDTFEYVEGGGPEQPTVVSIRGNTLGHRVESHFERLVSKVQLESIKAKTRAIAEGMQRERNRMEQEDEMSVLMHQNVWLHTFLDVFGDGASPLSSAGESAFGNKSNSCNALDGTSAQKGIDSILEEQRHAAHKEKADLLIKWMLEQAATTRHTSISGEVAKGVDSDVEGRSQIDNGICTPKIGGKAKGTELPTQEDIEQEGDKRCSGGAKHAQWLAMFGIRMRPQRDRKSEQDLLLEAAEKVASTCLRSHVTLPADPANTNLSFQDVSSGGRIPPVVCAFRGCSWCVLSGVSCSLAYEDDCEHPWDQELRTHISLVHGSMIRKVVKEIMEPERVCECEWDIYKEALAVQERSSIPVAGPSVERRVFEYMAPIYNDDRIRALICFACARVSGYRS